jgi:hypothetical protein
MENSALTISFNHTPGMVGDLQHWQYDTFKAHWRGHNAADAFVTFALIPDGTMDSAKMAAVPQSPTVKGVIALWQNEMFDFAAHVLVELDLQ